MSNQVVATLKTVLSNKLVDCLAGTIKYNQGNLSLESRGGVYGIAIKLDKKRKKDFFQKYNEKDIITFEEWKSIGDYYYPLYWGKDSNLGFRLFSHIHTRDSLGTLQLDSRQYLNQYFDKGKIIYGAVLCNKISCCETELRNTFPDIFITHVGKYDFPN